MVSSSSAATEPALSGSRHALSPAVEYHVRNVPQDYPLAELSHLFAAFGTVEDVSLSPVSGTPVSCTD